ncbi:hypothetical protein F7734_16000 [Scytonema sp. UIC 10036]|uniref:TrbI/VirB10 family protein n=1 Tax=Scytonema sp. UIC 10036 TaxID=2304196 RepID=UPI0012DA4903|nr:TrbI/VirB10 family protein [Scytonema sp. UIC 10036]MUG93833.1 hypothetical protein [Scytonema sp. UIC 10036]
MTTYKNPSPSISSSEDTPYNTGDFQLEDSSDLEARMARLVGLEEESPSSSDEGSVPVRQPSLSELQEPQEPQELQTKQPLSSNPFAKLGVVGAGTLAVVVVAGTFLTQLMSGTNNKPSTQNRSSIQEAPPQPKPESRLEQLERENEALKSKLALTEQALAVKAAQQQLRNLKPETPRIAARPNPPLEARDSSREQPRVIVQRIPAPPVVRTVYRDRIVTVDRPVRVRQAVARTPNPLPTQLPPVPPPLEPSVEFTPPPTPDPLQEWARLAKLGSYGQVSTPDNQNANNATIASRANEIPAPQPLVTPRPPVRITPESSTGSLIAQRRTKATKSTVVGSSAKATLVKGLYGAVSRGSRENNSNNQIVVVQLREALKAEDGSEVIPANAELHTKIRSISEGGLVDLNVDKVVWQDNGDRVEKSVPQDALIISGAGGKPPVATQYSGGGGSSIGRDALMFALGGAQKAGELINRPKEKCERDTYYDNDANGNPTILRYGSRYCFNSNSDPDLLAGVLDGGMRSVVPEVMRRSQQAQSQKAQRTNIWWIPAGTKMEVRVNRATQF